MHIKRTISRAMSPELRRSVKRLLDSLSGWTPSRQRREITALYSLLYELMHDRDYVPNSLYLQTKRAFETQWQDVPDGEFMLSDRWFKENVSRIISEEELQIRPDWFKGKKILDAGCGGGRWSYGFAKLGADITCVDVNDVALKRTAEALSSFDTKKRFILASLENLNDVLDERDFDLVWSWGVLHHCQSFDMALKSVTNHVKPGGVFYTYLYGRESISYEDDIRLFKERVKYNYLLDENGKYNYLLKRAGGDTNRIHQLHDEIAPLMNRRLTEQVLRLELKRLGFERIERVIESTELNIRAIKSGGASLDAIFLPHKLPPYWFQHH
jgi:2-polyprenyl-3-methyl-5-hydroxy-6-metoxy-1,4-benzoquinol methylase